MTGDYQKYILKYSNKNISTYEKKKKLWAGRFSSSLNSISEEISESISYDWQLYKYDIQASIAHVNMLAKCKIISIAIKNKIIKGLKEIEKEFEENKIDFQPSLEDIHTHVEQRLIELIGEDGKNLHTARSRNDQVAVDTHLFLKDHIHQQYFFLIKLAETFLVLGEKHKRTLWSGYTHLQTAQPTTLGHYLLCYFAKFTRDLKMLQIAYEATDQNPLGSAALTGVNYPIDRNITTKELKFNNIYLNSMDAISNRDYQLSYHFFASQFFTHISRICEDFILYNSSEFSYISLSDAVSTGSSIMPQKKNPDIAELLRGKTSRVFGNLVALLVNLKGLPMAYNRDLQEDKVYLFDTVKQVRFAILGLTSLLENTKFHPEEVEANLEKGFSQATDIADYLVREEKIPFRQAHEMTGRLVSYCEKLNKTIAQLSIKEIQQGIQYKINLTENIFNITTSLDMKKSYGACSLESMNVAIQQANKQLQVFKKYKFLK